MVLVLIALLPFHAFLVTVGTKLIAGPGHSPLAVLALWKEGVLGIILGVAASQILLKKLQVVRSEPETCNLQICKPDLSDFLILSLLTLSVIATFFTHNNWGLYAFGFRYDFIPLVAFFILRRVPWSAIFLQRAMRILLVAGSLIAAYGILSFFLPAKFFEWLGYSNLHSLYVPNGPVAPFQLIGETGLRRIQSVMSGPNQLGVWLLIPIGLLVACWQAKGSRLFLLKVKNAQLETCKFVTFFLCLAALFLTFSRAAWIGAFVLFAMALAPIAVRTPRKILIVIAGMLIVASIAITTLFPSVIVRISSSRGHIEGPVRAVQAMIKDPFGRGLGMAGPASNRVSDACVMLREEDDPTWAQAHPNLCVFLGNTQVQPVDRVCICPFLPENWYLQIGVEMGWLGLGLYLALVSGVLYRLWKLRIENEKLKIKESSSIKFSILNSQFSIFLAVSISALFLHAYEDAATAYTLWIFIAAALPVAHRAQNS